MRFRNPIKLVDDWRQAHHFASIQISVVMVFFNSAGISIFSAWNMIPEDLRAMLPNGWGRFIATIPFVLIAVTRIFEFRGKPEHEEQGE